MPMVVRPTGHLERGVRDEHPRKPRKAPAFTIGAKVTSDWVRGRRTKITHDTRKLALYDSGPGRIPIQWRTTLRRWAPSRAVCTKIIAERV
jgi:hypothetical protein